MLMKQSSIKRGGVSQRRELSTNQKRKSSKLIMKSPKQNEYAAIINKDIEAKERPGHTVVPLDSEKEEPTNCEESKKQLDSFTSKDIVQCSICFLNHPKPCLSNHSSEEDDRVTHDCFLQWVCPSCIENYKEENIHCVCNIRIKRYPMLQCLNCKLYSHKYCIQSNNESTDPYFICGNCIRSNYNSHNLNPSPDVKNVQTSNSSSSSSSGGGGSSINRSPTMNKMSLNNILNCSDVDLCESYTYEGIQVGNDGSPSSSLPRFSRTIKKMPNGVSPNKYDGISETVIDKLIAAAENISEGSLTSIKIELTWLGISHKVPDAVVERAFDYCKRLLDKRIMKSHTIYAFTVASFLIACRNESIPCTFTEIAKLGKVTKKEVGRSAKIILKVLEETMEHVSTEIYAERYCKALNTDKEFINIVIHVAKKAYDIGGVNGRCPLSIIAGSIYLVSMVYLPPSNLKKKDISDAVGVAEITLTNSFRAMLPNINNLLPSTTAASNITLELIQSYL